MGLADEVLPPDRADQAPVTAPLRELLRHLQWGTEHRPAIEIACDAETYSKLRTYFARPYRAQPTTFCLPLAEGTVWFRRLAASQEDDVARDATAAQAQLSAETGSWLERKTAEHVVSVEAMDGRVGAFVCKVAEPAVIDTETPATERADYGGAWKEPK